MAKNTDWLPSKRDGILAMAEDWSAVLLDKGSAWGVVPVELAAFNAAVAAAAAALQAAQQERSLTATQTCRDAFEALVAQMRFLKSRYFLSPPLTRTDVVSLLLTPKDSTYTPVPVPSNQVTAKTRPLGPGLLELIMEIIGDIEPDPYAADYGFSIYYCVLADGETVPDMPDKFLHQGFTRRKKEVVNRPENERGRKICFCIRLENAKGQQGPWGPIFWTIVP
jgi:hypothetical protein